MSALTALQDTARSYWHWAQALAPWPAPSRNPGKHHLLLLAWHFPPSISSGVHRPMSFANYGVANAWQVSVLAGSTESEVTKSGQALLDSLHPDIQVTRLAPSILAPSWKLFPRLDGDLNNAINAVNHAKAAYRDNPPTVIMATGPAFHNFVAATLLARHFKVPLVLDYRDEWSENPFIYTVDHKDGSKAWEARCLAAANAVLFTTRSQCDHQQKIFPGLHKQKVYYLPNGWVPSELGSQHTTRPSATGHLTLCYTGIIGDHTPVLDFMDTLQQTITTKPELANQITIELIGQKSPRTLQRILNHPASRLVNCIDHLPHEEAARKLQKSDALLLMATEQMARYRPGKLYQYVATGKPILSFGGTGEIASVIEGLKIGRLVVASDAGAMHEFFFNLMNGTPEYKADISVEKWLEKHSRESLAHDLFEMLDALVHGNTPQQPALPTP